MNTRAGKGEYILQTHSTKFFWRFNGGVWTPLTPPLGTPLWRTRKCVNRPADQPTPTAFQQQGASDPLPLVRQQPPLLFHFSISSLPSFLIFLLPLSPPYTHLFLPFPFPRSHSYSRVQEKSSRNWIQSTLDVKITDFAAAGTAGSRHFDQPSDCENACRGDCSPNPTADRRPGLQNP